MSDRCQAHLLAVGRRVCRDDERARDAVQDALLAAGEHLDDFRGDGSVEGWLVRMVANACKSWRRGRKEDPAWNAPLDDEQPACGGGGGERPSEVARQLDVSPESVRARLSRTRRRLRARLESARAGWTADSG